VDFKYDSACGEWCSNESHGMQGVGFWKNIRRVWGELSSHTRFEMGDGSKIHFWHDVWCGAKTLETSFLDLHCLF